MVMVVVKVVEVVMEVVVVVVWSVHDNLANRPLPSVLISRISLANPLIGHAPCHAQMSCDWWVFGKVKCHWLLLG